MRPLWKLRKARIVGARAWWQFFFGFQVKLSSASAKWKFGRFAMDPTLIIKLQVFEIWINSQLHWFGEGVYYYLLVNLFAFPIIVLCIGFCFTSVSYSPGPNFYINLYLHSKMFSVFFSTWKLYKPSRVQDYILMCCKFQGQAFIKFFLIF